MVNCISAEVMGAHDGIEERSNWTSERLTGPEDLTWSFVSAPLFWVGLPASVHAPWPWGATDSFDVTACARCAGARQVATRSSGIEIRAILIAAAAAVSRAIANLVGES